MATTWRSTFERRQCDAFRLDLKVLDRRAQALCLSEGGVEEGRLRESVRTESGFDSLIVMAMLQSEHGALCESRAGAS